VPHFYPIVLAGGKSLAGDSLGFHAYSLRIDNLTNQWLLEETSLAWIPPYSLGVCMRLYGTGVAILLNQAPVGQPQLTPIVGEQSVGVYSDQLRTEVAGTPVRQFTLVQAVSDLTQGPEPALPPVGVDRLWADPAGAIHHLHSDGTDLTLVDPSNAGTLLYPTFDPHYQALVNNSAVGGDSSGTVANMVNFQARAAFSIGSGTPALSMPGLSGGLQPTIQWRDVGAGITRIMGNTAGGVPASNLLRFDLANGLSGQSVTALTLDGNGLTTAQNGLAIASGTPALRLPAQAGGVAATIQWGDAGAGITRIMGNTVGGSAVNNVLRFDLATGTSGASVTVLTLDGSGKVTIPGGSAAGAIAVDARGADSFFGAGNASPSSTTGFLYCPFTGGAPSGTPTNVALGWVPLIFGPSNRLYAWLSGGWKSVTLT
jgi:hypothetical protein